MDNQSEANSFSLASIWNESLSASRVEREIEPRTHIWASELSGSYYDRFYRMKGRKPSTPPNLRSQRKFAAGNLTEFLVKQILERAGLLKETQTHISNTEFELEVTGRLDFLAGGEIKQIDVSDFPEGFDVVAHTVIDRLRELHPKGLRDQILEIKSCSGMMFNLYEKKPALHHLLQLFHYAHTMRLPGVLVYISRDDLRLMEWSVMPDTPQLMSIYIEDIKRMHTILSMDKPPLEPMLKFEDGKFKKNWHIEYSNYLDDYGYNRPDIYSEAASKLCSRLNRVIKKHAEGKELTSANLIAIDEGIMFCSRYNELKESDIHD